MPRWPEERVDPAPSASAAMRWSPGATAGAVPGSGRGRGRVRPAGEAGSDTEFDAWYFGAAWEQARGPRLCAGYGADDSRRPRRPGRARAGDGYGAEPRR